MKQKIFIVNSVMDNNKSLIILRGIPGSGKSTFAKTIQEGKYPIYSIDDYFTDSTTGKYRFEFDKNHLAYKQCQDRTENSMKTGEIKIIVDNVFSMEWEIEPYFLLAKKYNYQVFVLTVENRHGSTNIHEIPLDQIEKMKAKFKTIL